LAIEVQHALHTLEFAPNSKARLEWIRAEALRHQRRLFDGPVGRPAQTKAQPHSRVEPLPPVATWRQDGRLRIIEIRQARRSDMLANYAHLCWFATLD